MANTKSMGIGSMFVLLTVAVILLPMVVRYMDTLPHFAISGFQNVPNIPSNDSWRPDKNTSYLCRSPNNSGQPCPEGTFCDGPTNTCISNYVSGFDPTSGYYS